MRRVGAIIAVDVTVAALGELLGHGLRLGRNWLGKVGQVSKQISAPARLAAPLSTLHAGHRGGTEAQVLKSCLMRSGDDT